MKKILLFISMLVFVAPVYARENKLYFTESDDRIYYESKLLDEDVFMKHTEMVPGESFVDELIIENGTNTKYTLFFKVLPKEQSVAADRLLENIIMKISIDDKVVYEGRATGLDYTNSGINLQEAILLGDFVPSKESKMVVETMLSEEYSDTINNEFSYVDWAFYAQYEDSEPDEIIKIPNTMNNSFSVIPVFSIIIILLGLSIIFYACKKEN